MSVNPSKRTVGILLLAVCLASANTHSQPVSGLWKGRMGSQPLGVGRSYQVELRIQRDGDSLMGISDYRTLGNNHVRMPVKGYFNPYDGTVSWWHSAPYGVNEKGQPVQDLLPAGLTFSTDFNCPDGSTLKLDGMASLTTWSGRSVEIPVHLQKDGEAEFRDPWEQSVVGISPDPKPPVKVDAPAENPTPRVEPPMIGKAPSAAPAPKPAIRTEAPPERKEPAVRPDPKPVVVAPPPPLQKADERSEPKPVTPKEDPPRKVEPTVRPDPKPRVVAPTPPLQETVIRPEPKPVVRTVTDKERDPKAVTPIEQDRPAPPAEEKPLKPAEPKGRSADVPTPDKEAVGDLFRSRDRNLVQEVEVSGDTLWLNFYDHAEVDGDSISIFLGDRLLASHILLKATPYTLGIPLAEIGDSTDLTMVAENLGSIPPNTSLLILYVEGVRHEARLESTERSSAMIRFRKPMKRN
jgi:hypothetical protein